MGSGRRGEERVTARQTRQHQTDCQQSHSLLLHHQTLSERVAVPNNLENAARMGQSFILLHSSTSTSLCHESFTAKLKNQARRDSQIGLGERKIIVVDVIHLNDADSDLRTPVLLHSSAYRDRASQA